MDWPHAPTHRFEANKTYIVTAGTYEKFPYFKSPERLTKLQDTILESTANGNWNVAAWAIFPNHYHFVGHANESALSLGRLTAKIHMLTSRFVNQKDETPGRKVWHQYWDSQLTYEKSYFPRLKYVHNNAVHHGIVAEASLYQWCSAGWFHQNAPLAFQQTVMSFGTDRLKIPDDF